jgi:hypothetical protein
MILIKDAKLFFIKAIYKNHCVALPTELFFKEVLLNKDKHNGLNYISIWYKINILIFVIISFFSVTFYNISLYL